MNERDLYIESLQIDGKECEGIEIADNADMVAVDYDDYPRDKYDRPYRIYSARKNRSASYGGKDREKSYNGKFPVITQITLCVLIISAALVFRYADTESFEYLREQYQQAMARQIDFSEYGSALFVFMQQGGQTGVQSSQPDMPSGISQSEQSEPTDMSQADPVSASYMALPVEDAVLTSAFGEERKGNDGEIKKHKGVDLAVPMGTPITPVMSGRVEKAGKSDSYGNYVLIDHGNGLKSMYAHCSSVQCEIGQSVDALDVIAFAGATGDATGSHLHLEIRKDGECIDPMQYYAKDVFAQSSADGE